MEKEIHASTLMDLGFGNIPTSLLCQLVAGHLTGYKSSEHQPSLEHSCVATKNFKTQEQSLLIAG